MPSSNKGESGTIINVFLLQSVFNMLSMNTVIVNGH